MTWDPQGDGSARCSHGNVIDPSLGKQCPQCVSGTPIAVEDFKTEPPEPPKGCMTSVQLERWFVSVARASRASAKRVASRQFLAPRQKEAAIAKHRETGIKAMRAAAELALRREDEVLVNAREKRIRDRARGGRN